MRAYLFKSVRHRVFVLEPAAAGSMPSSEGSAMARIERLEKITRGTWDQIRKLQGRFEVAYLRRRYGSAQTALLLCFRNDMLVHIQWVVPSEVIRSRYPFVEAGCVAIIACRTAVPFRGKGIYAEQLIRLRGSGLSSGNYWIWAAESNAASLRGIRKAGAVEVGVFVQKKWFCGFLSHGDFKREQQPGW